MKYKFANLFFALSLLPMLLFAQNNGTYDIRILHYDTDLTNMKHYVDVEIKANSSSTEFRISDQNYRLTIDNSLTNPQIDAEFLSGFVDTSFYSPHTLTGSIGNIVSYNIELSGGAGVHVTADNYLKIGRLSFDIIDPNDCHEVSIRSKDPYDFPPTFVGEKLNGSLYAAFEGDLYDYLPCGKIELFAFLEGPFNHETDVMNYGFSAPLTQPFNTAPWNYTGNEERIDYNYVDWGMVELREDSSRASIVWRSPAIFLPDGTVMLRGQHALPLNHPNPLYLFIDHRNHMPVFVYDNPIIMDGSIVSIDLRYEQVNDSNNYLGLKEIKNGTFALHAGDFLKTNGIDITGADLQVWLEENGLFDGYFQSDINLDGVVDGIDRIDWNENNGLFSPAEN